MGGGPIYYNIGGAGAKKKTEPTKAEIKAAEAQAKARDAEMEKNRIGSQEKVMDTLQSMGLGSPSGFDSGEFQKDLSTIGRVLGTSPKEDPIEDPNRGREIKSYKDSISQLEIHPIEKLREVLTALNQNNFPYDALAKQDLFHPALQFKGLIGVEKIDARNAVNGIIKKKLALGNKPDVAVVLGETIDAYVKIVEREKFRKSDGTINEATLTHHQESYHELLILLGSKEFKDYELIIKSKLSKDLNDIVKTNEFPKNPTGLDADILKQITDYPQAQARALKVSSAVTAAQRGGHAGTVGGAQKARPAGFVGVAPASPLRIPKPAQGAYRGKGTSGMFVPDPATSFLEENEVGWAFQDNKLKQGLGEGVSGSDLIYVWKMKDPTKGATVENLQLIGRPPKIGEVDYALAQQVEVASTSLRLEELNAEQQVLIERAETEMSAQEQKRKVLVAKTNSRVAREARKTAEEKAKEGRVPWEDVEERTEIAKKTTKNVGDTVKEATDVLQNLREFIGVLNGDE